MDSITAQVDRFTLIALIHVLSKSGKLNVADLVEEIQAGVAQFRDDGTRKELSDALHRWTETLLRTTPDVR